MAATCKFPNIFGKLMIGKTLASNEEVINNTMLGNDILAIYWKSLLNWSCKALGQIGDD